jgi:hypothetical protein
VDQVWPKVLVYITDVLMEDWLKASWYCAFADIATVVVLKRPVKEETHELVETLLLKFPCDNLV